MAIIAPELSARITKFKTLIDAGVIDHDLPSSNGQSFGSPDMVYTLYLYYSFHADENPKSTCPFWVYAQVEPSSVSEVLMQELENELQKPTGVSTVKPPKLSISGLMISKECGIIYEVTNTEGLRFVINWDVSGGM